MKPANTVQEKKLFVLRDADALGITLEDSNGQVRIRNMSLPGLGGLQVKDGILCSSLEEALSQLLDSTSQSKQMKFLLARPIPAATGSTRFAQRGDSHCRKGKYFEAAATYALVEEDDPLVLANRCAALQLCGRIDEASVESNKVIQKWPNWEMGYVRKAACQVALNDIHGAIRILAQGLTQLPDNSALLRRLRVLIPAKENEITCLGDEPDTILSVVRSKYFIVQGVDRIVKPMDGIDKGMILAESFHPLIPSRSLALSVNGVQATFHRFADLRARLLSDTQVVIICWVVPSVEKLKATLTSAILHGSVSSMANDQDEKQLALKLSAVPQCFDQVVVFGAAVEKCNGDYYPQGTRNERPWFENESGVTLSYEQAESGTCGWVIGMPSERTIFYVLRPGHEPRGEDFGQWLPAEDTPSPGPTFVGVGEKVPSLKKLTTWIKDNRSRAAIANSSGSQTMIPHLLALKGHAIRLLEGGWTVEALPILQLVEDQAIALAVGDERCSTTELARLAESARELAKSAQMMMNSSSPGNFVNKAVDLNVLYSGFTLHVFEDQTRQVEFRVLDGKDVLQIKEKTKSGSSAKKTKKNKSYGRYSFIGCISAPPPPPSERRGSALGHTREQWNRNEIDYELISIGGSTGKMFKIFNRTKSWEMTMPDENVLEALKVWIGKHLNSQTSSADSWH